MCGGAISSSTLFPLELIKTRAQAHTKKTSTGDDDEGKDDDNNTSKDEEPPNTLTIAAEIYKEAGIAGFWANFHYSALQSATEKSIYFMAYSALKGGYEKMVGRRAGTIETLMLGCCGEWAHLPVSMPLDVLTTKLQTNKTGDSAYVIMSQGRQAGRRSFAMRHIFLFIFSSFSQTPPAVFSEKGLSGLYHGVEAYKVLCLKPAIQYTVYEYCKEIVLKTRPGEENLASAEVFFLGMVARAVSTIICFPYTRGKVMVQSAKSGSNEENESKVTITDMLLKMYKEEVSVPLF